MKRLNNLKEKFMSYSKVKKILVLVMLTIFLASCGGIGSAAFVVLNAGTLGASDAIISFQITGSVN